MRSSRVYVVEDEEHMARGLCFNLEREGYETECFVTAEAALEQLRAPPGPRVDLLVLDVMLPGMSGLDLLKVLRGAGNSIPVLLLTALDSEADVVEGLRTRHRRVRPRRLRPGRFPERRGHGHDPSVIADGFEL